MRFPAVDSEYSLAFDPKDVSTAELPGLQVTVSLRLGAFSGVSGGVWFEQEALNEFAAQLRALEVDRRGSARLSAMSPGECDLRVEAYDPAGHCRLEIRLSAGNFSGDERIPTTLSGAFDLDGEYLSEICAGVEKLAALSGSARDRTGGPGRRCPDGSADS